MEYFWLRPGAQRRGDGAFVRAANELGCDLAALLAVWEVEAGGVGLWKDGTIKRRFEPHHMPGASKADWRKSLTIPRQQREQMMRKAYRSNPDAVLLATSWHGPQIMGFNHLDAGYVTARDMVEDMIRDPDASVRAFVSLIQAWGIDGALRSHDWLTFARRYNGSGQAQRYANLIEAAYRRNTNRATDPVLRVGAKGAAVRELQRGLGITVDGLFGAETDDAVRQFQFAKGLKADGIVGARTWAELRKVEDVPTAPLPGNPYPAPATAALALAVIAGGAALWNWITNREESHA